MSLFFIWTHTLMAVLALAIGGVNLASRKGTKRHKAQGWAWMVMMAFVTISSFFIQELNRGSYSWIHGLTLWTMFCMVVAIFAIRKGSVRTHASFMVGTMIGATVAGVFALMPGRFLSEVLG